MSDLISRKALLEELEAQDYYGGFLVRLITNAPAINSLQNCDAQGEPLAWVDSNGHLWWDSQRKNFPEDTDKPLYATPLQPQEQDNLVGKAVKDALEKAARICDEHAKQMKEWKAQDYVIGMADTGAMVCADAIRALIED